IIGIGSNSPVCFRDTIKLTAMSDNGNAKYLWTGPRGFSSTLPGHYIINATDSQSGIYKLIVTLDKCSNIDSINVTVKPYVPPIVSSNSPVKAGDDLRLFAEGVPGAGYQWNGPDSFQSNVQNPVISFVPDVASGQYSVTMTDADGC